MITLKTLPSATAQEVFNQTVIHLLTQGVKAVGTYTNSSGNSSGNSYGSMYRGVNNTACAAGCFIADDEYSEDMEGELWDTLVDRGRVPDSHADLIGQLQKVHDTTNPNTWYQELLRIAEDYCLNKNVLLLSFNFLDL